MFETIIVLQLFTTRHVNTVPDKVLENSRYSKLGSAIKSPSVEEPRNTKYKSPKFVESNRDYKLKYSIQ